MMAHVMQAHHLIIAALRRKMMERVVREIIPEITRDEAGKERRNPLRRTEKLRNNEPVQTVEEQRQLNAHRGRHHQACLGHGLRMMDAMKEKRDAFLPGIARAEVKEEAVQHIFGKSPDKDSKQ